MQQNGLTKSACRAYNRQALSGTFKRNSRGKSVVLKDSLSQLYRKVIFLQVFLALVAAAIALLAAGGREACSALAGGMAVIAGNLAYSLLARPAKVGAASGKTVLGRHIAAEAAKILVVLGLVLGALLAGGFAAGWLVAAMGLCLLGNWVAVLIIR
jgi:F0F1-type ATP synthase assembly protein I